MIDIIEYIPNVRKLIRRRGLDVEEHLGVAYEGLLRAAKNYDGRAKFWTFAQHHVLGAILDYRRSQGYGTRSMRKTGKVPQHVQVHENIPEKIRASSDLLDHLCGALDRTDKLIVSLCYKEDLTMRETGNAIGISESRVSQRHAAILRNFKERLNGTYR